MGEGNHCRHHRQGNVHNSKGSRQQDQEEPGCDTKRRRIPNEDKIDDKNATEEAKDNDATTELPQQEETHVQDDPEEEGQQELEQDEQGPNAGTEDSAPEEDKSEQELSEEEKKEANKSAKRYNLRKRKYKTVYVSASKIF
jgi:hypothetical protein